MAAPVPPAPPGVPAPPAPPHPFPPDEATTYERTIMRDYDRKALDEVKARGMQVTTLSDAERARMAEKLKPVTDKFVTQFGAASAQELMAELGRIRAAAK